MNRDISSVAARDGADSFLIVFDWRHIRPSEVLPKLTSKRWIDTLPTLAREARYLVAAGHPHVATGEGVFMATDKPHMLPCAAVLANGRLAKTGARRTCVLVVGRDALRDQIMQALADQVATEGNA